MDINTKRNLELTETLRLKQRQYSLLWLLDKTKTAPGARRLKNLVLNPLIDKEELENRYDKLEKLSNEFLLKDELRDKNFQEFSQQIKFRFPKRILSAICTHRSPKLEFQ